MFLRNDENILFKLIIPVWLYFLVSDYTCSVVVNNRIPIYYDVKDSLYNTITRFVFICLMKSELFISGSYNGFEFGEITM